MYKLSIPLMNHSLTPQTRPVYLKQLRDGGVERVFLTIPGFEKDEKAARALTASLKENIAFLEQEGFEAGIWVGSTIGHGVPLLGVGNEEKEKFLPVVDFSGQEIPYTNCPLDPQFRTSIANFFAILATAGAKLILLDDDFRLSQHGNRDFCCACDMHLQRINSYCNQHLTREQMRPLVFGGEENAVRDAWLRAEGESLYELAQLLRDTVDAVDPDICLALCSSYSIWDVDGTDVHKLVRILAGKNKPVLRLHGAPYWAFHNSRTLPDTFEVARTLASFCKDMPYETMAEGDVYPRPRYNTPASYLELCDAMLRADGQYNGILKYMFDYAAPADYETGYLERHCRDLPLLHAIEKAFPKGANLGVRVRIQPGLLKKADLTNSDFSDQSPYPAAGVLLSSCSIPTVYSGEGLCNAVFGENARYISEKELGNGAILDASAAVLLTRSGIDVGLCEIGERVSVKLSSLISHDPICHATVRKGGGKLLSAKPHKKATPVLFAQSAGEEKLFAYRYENDKKQRFLVYLFDASSLPFDTGLLKGYLQQRILTDAVQWISERPLPARCTGHPELYMLCGETEDRLSIALFNCFADSIPQAVIELADSYREAEFIGCEGELVQNRVTLRSELHAFRFAAIILKK